MEPGGGQLRENTGERAFRRIVYSDGKVIIEEERGSEGRCSR